MSHNVYKVQEKNLKSNVNHFWSLMAEYFKKSSVCIEAFICLKF